MVSREVGRACAPCASLKSLFRIKCWGAGENRPARRRVGFTPASSRPIGRIPTGGGHWREGPKVEYSPREATRADPRHFGVGLCAFAIPLTRFAYVFPTSEQIGITMPLEEQPSTNLRTLSYLCSRFNGPDFFFSRYSSPFILVHLADSVKGEFFKDFYECLEIR